MGNEIRRCVVISAAPNSDISFFKGELTENDLVICADGGYVHARSAGIQPDLIVGDFDSAPEPKSDIQIIALPREKDDTDTMYAIKYGVAEGCKDFVLLAAAGGREDHAFANYSALLYLKHRGCTGKILTARSRTFLLENERFDLSGLKGKTFSIFPFGCASCLVTLEGLYYPLSDYELTADFPLGVSNIITSESATVSVRDGSVIIFITDGE